MTPEPTIDLTADGVIAEYLRAVDRGERPDRDEFLRDYPGFVGELRAFFADTDRADAGAEALRPAPPVGTSLKYIGDYELLGEIARGGMGVVYRARQVSLDRVVALKMVLAGEFAAPAVRDRFRLEVMAVARLDHPNIVPVYEVGEYDRQPYFSMRLIESDGRSIDDYRLPARGGREAQVKLAAFVAELARAVHYAHQRGVIHRDLKPANILIDEVGRPHVTDFGLAKSAAADDVTASGAILGTPAYMAPEQALQAKDATTQSDIYSLGAILYWLLTGRPPFQGDGTLETLRQLTEDAVVPPSRRNGGVDRDLEAICLKCLEKQPADRYLTAAALADDLENWVRGDPISVRPAGAVQLVKRWVRRHVRAAVWIIAVGLIGGTLSSLAVAQGAMAVLISNAIRTYAHFPSVAVPETLSAYHAAFSLMDVVPFGGLVWPVIGGLLALGIGGIAVTLARPRDVVGDIGVGVGTALVSALPGYFISVGPAVILAYVVVPQIATRIAVAQGCYDPRPPEAALAKLQQSYPDLARLADDKERADKFFALQTAEMVAGTFASMWVGLLLTLAMGLVTVVAQAVAAGGLLRRHGSWKRVWLSYLEVSAAWLGVTWAALTVLMRMEVGPVPAEAGQAWLLVVSVLMTAVVSGFVAWDFAAHERWLAYLTVVLWCGRGAIADPVRLPLAVIVTAAMLSLFVWRGSLAVTMNRIEIGPPS